MNLVGIGGRGSLGTHCSGKQELVHTEGTGSPVDGESSHKHRRKSGNMVVRAGSFRITVNTNKHLEKYFHGGDQPIAHSECGCSMDRWRSVLTCKRLWRFTQSSTAAGGRGFVVLRIFYPAV